MLTSPEEGASVDPTLFRRVVGRFATGIAVVTTRSDGVDHAMTVNSLTSVSLDPLLVLFCVERVARFHCAVLDAGHWAVSILGAGGELTSRWFASRGRALTDQLARVGHTVGPLSGAPVLDAAIGVLECRTRGVYDGGDHSIVLGEVLAASVPSGPAVPLLHYEGSYRRLEGGDS